MGDVWRAKDAVLRRTVAVKILLPELLANADFAARFRIEAHTMATLDHPGIVDIYDYDHSGDIASLVMQYVDGESLNAMLNRAGKRPFEATTPLSVALKHVQEQPPPLPAGVPAEARDLVMVALAKEAGGRWPDATAMAEAAWAAAEGMPVPQPATTGGQTVNLSAATGPAAAGPAAGGSAAGPAVTGPPAGPPAGAEADARPT